VRPSAAESCPMRRRATSGAEGVIRAMCAACGRPVRRREMCGGARFTAEDQRGGVARGGAGLVRWWLSWC